MIAGRSLAAGLRPGGGDAGGSRTDGDVVSEETRGALRLEEGLD